MGHIDLTRFLVVLTALGLAAPASAGAPAAAQALVDRGTKSFKRGDFGVALKSFEQAYASTGDGGLHYVIGRCHEELGDLTAAVAAYERFLRTDAPEEARSKAEEAMRRLRARLSRGRLVLRVEPPGARVSVDGRDVGAAPLGPLDVDSGRHTVVARLEGHTLGEVTVDVSPGGEGTATLSLSEAPATPAPVPHLQDSGVATTSDGGAALEGWGWATFTVGLALAAGGTVAFGLGESDHRGITDTPGYGNGSVINMTRQAALALEESGNDKKTAGYALWGAGGAALVTSIVLLLVDVEDGGDGVSFGLSPSVGGAFVGATGSF